MNNFEKYLDFEYLWSLGVKPEWFGLGFIQMKISDTQRIHFWHPSLFPQVNDPHNHRYEFHSTILHGEVVQELYDVEMFGGGDYEVKNVDCSEGFRPSLEGRANVVSRFKTRLSKGSDYRISANQFHKITAHKAVTYVTRPVEPQKEYAQVVSIQGKEDVCPFEVKLDQSQIWSYIKGILPSPIGYHESEIKKGTIGHLSKIREEIDELIDSQGQDVRIMELVELSDIIGAIDCYMENNHSGYNLDDLIGMAEVTKRAFKNGHR